jgi:GDP-4-dehydro-6-deoxy-D-mannose reductase
VNGPVLVTGAAGFAGSHLVELLSQLGHAPIGWRRPAGIPAGLPSIEWHIVDLLDADLAARSIAELRPAVVFHCAGAPHVGRSWTAAGEFLATNVLATHNLFRALRIARLRARVLIPGSSMVYRQSDRAISEDDPVKPASPYALSKLAQEMLGHRSIEEDGQAVMLTRSFNHIGPRQDPSFAASGFARQIALIEAGREPPVIEVGNLDARRDLTDVRDTVRAYVDLVDKGRPGVVYNVCSGQAHRIGDLLEQLVAKSRVPVEVRVDPSRFRPSDMPLSQGNRERIERDVGWHPTIPIARTLADLLEYWRAIVGVSPA